jgi:hypothetical protein
MSNSPQPRKCGCEYAREQDESFAPDTDIEHEMSTLNSFFFLLVRLSESAFAVCPRLLLPPPDPSIRSVKHCHTCPAPGHQSNLSTRNATNPEDFEVVKWLMFGPRYWYSSVRFRQCLSICTGQFAIQSMSLTMATPLGSYADLPALAIVDLPQDESH